LLAEGLLTAELVGLLTEPPIEPLACPFFVIAGGAPAREQPANPTAMPNASTPMSK